ncbi:MAG: hypothetical protein HY747_05725 [Elusimicrobia bacterium]|nr:hypothetical protein [Elusimicrobiota bacterium]
MRRSLLGLSCRQFLADWAIKRWGAKIMVLGANFTMGRGRAGNASNFQALAGPLGLEWKAVPLFDRVSSSVVRDLLAAGRLSRANKLMGRRFCLSGKIVRGRAIAGRLLGFPTANLHVDEDKLLPLGVFSARVKDFNKKAVVNIGCRPTVKAAERQRGREAERQGEGTGERCCRHYHNLALSAAPPLRRSAAPCVEAHILDFHGDLYGKDISLELIREIRREKKFSSLNELRRQIARDIKRV